MAALIPFVLLLAFVGFVPSGRAQESAPATAHYLGNEGVLITAGDTRVLFDPFFNSDYGRYQRVPEAMRAAIFAGAAPFDGIDVVFVSHAHGDHFSAEDLVRYLAAHPRVELVAPAQAVALMDAVPGAGALADRVHGLALAHGDPPAERLLGAVAIEAVRIPHSGWPGRADVSNLVYRVTLAGEVTVMHMGDADADDTHFAPYLAYWRARRSQTNFPPYWFFTRSGGALILEERLNADAHVGIHVPRDVPDALDSSGARYFSRPGEVTALMPPPSTSAAALP